MSESPGPTLAPVAGGCLCGAVRYTATPEHRDGYYCHCRMCQLAFGNTRAAFLNLRKSELTWTATPPSYYASSKFARRGFCPTCGTPLSFEYLGSERMDLSIGSLDDPSQFKPVSHFSVETRIAQWHTPDALEEIRLDTYEALMKRWRDAYGDAVKPGVEATR